MQQIIIDSHFDLTFDLVRRSPHAQYRYLEASYDEEFTAGKIGAFVSAVYIDDAYLDGRAHIRAVEHIKTLYAELETNAKYTICRNSYELMDAINSDQVGIFLALEGIEPIGGNLERLEEYYKLGVRMLSLTWSRRNMAAEGCPFEHGQDNLAGLTPFGREVVRAVQERSIILDISHLNETGFWEIMEMHKGPVIASHSNCRAICDTPRNLSDQQILAIARKEGYIGINAASILIDESDDKVSVKRLVDHVDHIVKIAGINHVAFGFDFCNRIMSYVEDGFLELLERVPFDCINGHGEVGLIIEELRHRGYSNSDIGKITHQNFLRVVRKVLDRSGK